MSCAYHGWKFGDDGRCLAMPSEPLESSFASKVRHVAYPCEERGGVVFAYMGPGSPPPLPQLEWTLLPEANTLISKRVQECNWFQALEGGIDSSHISFLHAPISHTDTRDRDRAGQGELRHRRGGADGRHGAALRDRRHGLRRADRGAAVVAGRAVLLAHQPVPHALLHDAADGPRRADDPVAHLGADGRHQRRQLDGHVASRPGTHERGAGAAHRGQGRACLRLRAGYLRSLRRRAHRRQPRQRLRHGLGSAPHAHVLRHPGFRRAGPGHPGEPGTHRGPHAGAPRLERHARSSTCAASSWAQARALRIRARRARVQNPESFCVRSTSLLLPPEANWVEGATARVVVKPGAQLTLA